METIRSFSPNLQARFTPFTKGARPEAYLHLADALAGPFEDIPVHPECFSMDYEVPSFLPVCIIRTVTAGLDAPG